MYTDIIMIITAIASILIALASGVIAIIALRASIRSGEETRKHNKLSVRPLLSIDNAMSEVGNRGFYSIRLSNCGIGPAIITDVKLFFDGVPVPYSGKPEFGNFIWDKIKDFDVRRLYLLAPKDALVAGGEKTLWEFYYVPQVHNIDQVRKIDLLIEYESFYGKKMPPCGTENAP